MAGFAALAAVWLVFALLGGFVGWLLGKGKDRSSAGFWLGLLFGFIGWIIVAVMEPSEHERRGREQRAASLAAEALTQSRGAAVAVPHTDSQTPGQTLEAMADLRKRGVITDEEFAVAKRKLLDKM